MRFQWYCIYGFWMVQCILYGEFFKRIVCTPCIHYIYTFSPNFYLNKHKFLGTIKWSKLTSYLSGIGKGLKKRSSTSCVLAKPTKVLESNNFLTCSYFLSTKSKREKKMKCHETNSWIFKITMLYRILINFTTWYFHLASDEHLLRSLLHSFFWQGPWIV